MSRITVLAVEDDASVRTMLVTQLADVFSMIGADSIHEARKQVADYHPDVVVLDLDLPDAKGVDAVIAMHHVSPGTPVVIHASGDALEECIRAGAMDFVAKGTGTLQHLKDTIRTAYYRRQAESSCCLAEQAHKESISIARDAIANTVKMGDSWPS